MDKVLATAKSFLTAERLRELLRYDPDTGVFIRLVTTAPNAPAGGVAGYVSKQIGYVLIGIDREDYLGHRLAWLYMTGEWPQVRLDHRDGNRANNAWINLRLSTQSQNVANSRRRKASASGFKGVSFCKFTGRWRAVIKQDYKFRCLGRFDTPEAAHAAYCEAARMAFGEFARDG